MIEEQVRYWRKYRKWVERKNANGRAEFKVLAEQYIARSNAKWALYEKKVSDWKKRRADHDKLCDDWRSLPWWKRIVTPEPDPSPYWYTFGRPFTPGLEFPPIYIPAERVSMRGFYDWLARKKSL